MINILIADNNINFAIRLMNYLNKENSNIKVCSIVKSEQETIEILNFIDNIDIVLLNYNMLINKKTYILGFLKNKKADKSVIYKKSNVNIILNKVNPLIRNTSIPNTSLNIEKRIIKELMYLGYEPSHKGTQYLIKAIAYASLDSCRELENLTKDIYPQIALLYNDSVHNIKCRINVSTNVMYCNCEASKLKDYFHLDVDTKPKTKTIINTILNNLKL